MFTICDRIPKVSRHQGCVGPSHLHNSKSCCQRRRECFAAKFQRPIRRRAERFMQLPLQHFSKLKNCDWWRCSNSFRPGSDGQYISPHPHPLLFCLKHIKPKFVLCCYACSCPGKVNPTKSKTRTITTAGVSPHSSEDEQKLRQQPNYHCTTQHEE